jgi:hypothetical protein
MNIKQFVLIGLIFWLPFGCTSVDTQIAPIDAKEYRQSILDYFQFMKLPPQVIQNASEQFTEQHIEQVSREFCYNFTREVIPPDVVAQKLAEQYANYSPKLTQVLLAVNLTFIQKRCTKYYPGLIQAIQQNVQLQRKFEGLFPDKPAPRPQKPTKPTPEKPDNKVTPKPNFPSLEIPLTDT